jgi:hypothetical protein
MVNVVIERKYTIDGVIAVGFGSYQGSVVAGRVGEDMRKLKYQSNGRKLGTFIPYCQ